MKRPIAAALAAIALFATAPASADDPSATLKIRDHGAFEFQSNGADFQAGGWLSFERIMTPGPTVDPNSVFPVVVDPNDPPEPPASAMTESLTVSGFLFYCDWSVGECSDLSLPQGTPAEDLITIDDLPLPGNAISLAGTFNLDGAEMVVQVRAERPAVTRLWTDNTAVHPNVWTDGSDVHAETDTSVPLLTRHSYAWEGSITIGSGTNDLTHGYAVLNRDLRAFTSADAVLPA